MDTITLGVFAVIIIAVIVLFFALGGASTSLPVVAKPLMTNREREAIALIEAHYPGCRVHAQVAMGAIIATKKGLSAKQKASVRNRFDRKIVDFVVERKATGEIVALIELDDRTHNAAKDKARDAITEAAGYRTIRIPAGTKLASANLRPLFATANAA